MITLKIQGGKVNGGWRYTPYDDKKDEIKELASRIPQWIADVTASAVWWKCFNPEQEKKLLQAINSIGEINIEPPPSPEEGSLEEETKPQLTDEQIIQRLLNLLGERTKKAEILGRNDRIALVKMPPKPLENKSAYVVKYDFVDRSRAIVWDCSRDKDGKLGKNRLEELIRRELG